MNLENTQSILFPPTNKCIFIPQDLLSVLSGPDRLETGDRGLTGADKMTLYIFLRDVNEKRNNKVMAQVPPVSRESSVDRLQEVLSQIIRTI